MRASLIRHVDPWQEAVREACHEGKLEAARVPRVSVVGEFLGPLQVRISFNAPAGHRFAHAVVEIDLEVSGCIATTCQRCLNAMTLSPVIHSKVLVVADEAAERDLASVGDVFVSSPGEHIELASLVEDELILALPLALSHPDGQCPVPLGEAGEIEGIEMARDIAAQGLESDGVRSGRPNPFAQLASLRRSVDEDS
jgi:uncharacterized protein